MGIKSFSQLIKKRCSEDASKEIDASFFEGKRIAIDMNQQIYVLMYVASKDLQGKDYTTEDLEKSTMKRILSRIVDLVNFNVTPVCVFDGNADDAKNREIEKRRQRKEKLSKRIKDARDSNDSSTLEKLSKYDFKITREFIQRVINTIRSMGIPVFDLKEEDYGISEAEGFCASLCLSGNDYCEAAITTDSDFHVYGGDMAITKMKTVSIMTLNGLESRIVFTVRSLDKIMNDLQLDFSEFIDLCILMGTDYNDNIKGIGPVKAYDIIKECRNLEAVEGLNDPRIDMADIDYRNIRDIYNKSITELEILPTRLDIDCETLVSAGVEILSEYGLDQYSHKVRLMV